MDRDGVMRENKRRLVYNINTFFKQEKHITQLYGKLNFPKHSSSQVIFGRGDKLLKLA